MAVVTLEYSTYEQKLTMWNFWHDIGGITLSSYSNQNSQYHKTVSINSGYSWFLTIKVNT